MKDKVDDANPTEMYFTNHRLPRLQEILNDECLICIFAYRQYLMIGYVCIKF